jgi:peptide/nickel transport system substrate-binding protein/oligopeptide transport system substrate-binding protein
MSGSPQGPGARLAIIAALIVVALAVAVPTALKNAPREPQPQTKDSNKNPSARSNGPTVFRFYQENPASLDPPLASDSYSSCVVAQIYSPLVGLTSDLEPTPQVAESWTISRDGKKYVFRIRPGVKFHSGREVTARDFEYSLTRVFKEPFRSEGLAAGYLDAILGAREFMAGKAKTVRGIRVVDDRTLEITLTRPYSSLLTALALDQTSAVPREIMEAKGPQAMEQHPIGTGPFLFVRREAHQAVVLAANPNYFLGRPTIDTLVFYSPHGDVTNLGADALLEGRATLSQLPTTRIEEFRARPGVAVLKWNDLSLAFLGMNALVPPFNDARVRQAVALAIDRQAMLNRRPEGKSLATGILPPGLPGYAPAQKTYPRDVRAAKALLAQAGYGPSNPLPNITMYRAASNSELRTVDSVMVSSLREAGITVRVLYEPWAVLDRLITNRTAAMFALAWVADIPDPDTFLRALFYSTSSTNYFQFKDAAIDSLLDAARATSDPNLRLTAYRRAEEAILRSAPFIPLTHTASFIGLRDDVTGLEMNPLGISTLAIEKLHLGDRNDADGRSVSR